jgi:hypothetical protein
MELKVIPFDMASAGDAEGIQRALGQLPLARLRQVAVIAKVEGTATLNDSSRELASARIAAAIAGAGGRALAARTLEILSVGCEGLITPGGWVIASLRAAGRRRIARPVGATAGGKAAALAAAAPRSRCTIVRACAMCRRPRARCVQPFARPVSMQRRSSWC